MLYTVQLNNSWGVDATSASHSREGSAPLCTSLGATLATSLLLGPKHTLPQGSEFPFPLQWMGFSWLSVWHTGFLPPNIPTERPFLTMRCPRHPACLVYPPHATAPSRTLLLPLHLVPCSILRSCVSLLTAHLPLTTRAQTPAVCSAAASPARGPGIDTHSCWVNEQTLPCQEGKRWNLNSYSQIPEPACVNHSTVFRGQANQVSFLRFSHQTCQVGMITRISLIWTLGLSK